MPSRKGLCESRFRGPGRPLSALDLGLSGNARVTCFGKICKVIIAPDCAIKRGGLNDGDTNRAGLNDGDTNRAPLGPEEVSFPAVAATLASVPWAGWDFPADSSGGRMAAAALVSRVGLGDECLLL
ncbi:hypothetical protein SKAU_G00324110 [Synaphobranchus kaupii]|uniref:Uncharacterized protein n=1 Tax=Synaphobranchus kaupii TaxID=118154 RepID=A0A9Q1EPE7_SYNKA|nr:hypothetical protein SKAU_G00324110 [Synaphobranchus kaupii]